MNVFVGGTGVFVFVNVFVGGIGVLVFVGVFVGTTGVLVAVIPPLFAPTKETTLCAGREYVKLLPETDTAACATRLVPEFVSHGVTEVAPRLFKLKVWLVAEVLLLIATITNFVGEEVLVSLKALTNNPEVGAAVAAMR